MTLAADQVPEKPTPPGDSGPQLSSRASLQDRFRGILLGTAVGDALGLPRENLRPRRAQHLFPGPLGHRFVFRHGMVSDDTDQALFVAQSLLAHPGSSEDFARRLSFCLRFWLLSLPAGIGFATLRAILRLWFGKSPDASGVFSAGNGPAMRSAIIGAFFADRPGERHDFVRAATVITHSDPKAETGARAIAEIAAWSMNLPADAPPALSEFLKKLAPLGGDDQEWQELVQKLSISLQSTQATSEFAHRLGLENGVTGYMYHTVPVVLHAWFRHFGQFSETLEAVIGCGGDTDTTGAIAGAMAGAVVGESGMPPAFVAGIFDWPRGVPVMRKIADQLAQSRFDARDTAPVSWPMLLYPLRNLLFLAVVLAHVCRRLLPF